MWVCCVRMFVIVCLCMSRSAYETSQAYRNWKSSGQNDGINFYPNFQQYQPLHVMLHTFIHGLGLSGFALSSMDAEYAFCTSQSIETQINGKASTPTKDPKCLRAKLTSLRETKKATGRKGDQAKMVQVIRDNIIKANEDFEKNKLEAQIQDAWAWQSMALENKLKWKEKSVCVSDSDSDFEDVQVRRALTLCARSLHTHSHRMS